MPLKCKFLKDLHNEVRIMFNNFNSIIKFEMGLV